MARLTYAMGVSLDGYITDADGDFGWGAPDEALHRYYNEQTRGLRGFVFGRRVYELMEPHWPRLARDEAAGGAEAEFARIYVGIPRLVVSDTLADVPDGVTLVRRADAAAQVRRLKEAGEGRLGIGGATLAAALFDLIDEFELRVHPVLVGGGTPYFPPLGDRAELRLVGSRTLSGVVILRYERAGAGS
ncbi:dihydrofolate reductase family protein [Miltoncostaea marina]|uniref:dihydrofolate reductase family protein n=1 Tax=Miltoncostaea marina TaxID=2843215 RepID=UPI001C3D7D81|nr:dihydrofolate reductase family protein [Miltoncostaea marina]